MSVGEEDKVELGNLLDMDTVERIDLLIHSAQGVIDNGGLYYFFESDFPGRPPYLLFINAYKEIGDFKSADCLENAVKAFPFHEPHLHVEKRLEYLSSIQSQGAFDEIFPDAICGNKTVWDRLNKYKDNEDINLKNIILNYDKVGWVKAWCKDSIEETIFFYKRIRNLFTLKSKDSKKEIPIKKIAYTDLQENEGTYFIKKSHLIFNGMAFAYYEDKTPKLASIILNGKKRRY